MSGGHGAGSLALVADFRAVLLAEGTVMFLLFVLLAIGWVACREMLLARARAWLAAQRNRWPAEPTGRRVLRIGFGVLWIVDGLLQAQPGMPAGLASQVMAPSADGSPGWVAHIVKFGTQIWSGSPADVAAGAVWIQLGIGIWLVSVSSPRWSRVAGVVSLGWGLVVWVFGEAFGGILGPHLSWLTGAPGAALFYCIAGVLLALPVRAWQDPQLGRRMLQACGALLAAAAVLQAWPGRRWWQGTLPGPGNSRLLGPLPAFIGDMSSASQPAALHDLVGWFAGVVATHGFAVNLVAVVMLGAAGAGLLTGRPAIARPVAGAAIGLCLAVWVLVQDLGVFGGLGTDPNSMLPQAVILAAGLTAAVRRTVPLPAGVPVPVASGMLAETVEAAPVEASQPTAPVQPAHGRLGALHPGPAARRLGRAFGTASASAVLAVWATVMVMMGAAPMAIAAAHRGAAQVEAVVSPRQAVLGQRADPQATSGALVEQSGQR
jgi:hypothetical protein